MKRDGGRSAPPSAPAIPPTGAGRPRGARMEVFPHASAAVLAGGPAAAAAREARVARAGPARARGADGRAAHARPGRRRPRRADRAAGARGPRPFAPGDPTRASSCCRWGAARRGVPPVRPTRAYDAEPLFTLLRVRVRAPGLAAARVRAGPRRASGGACSGARGRRGRARPSELERAGMELPPEMRRRGSRRARSMPARTPTRSTAPSSVPIYQTSTYAQDDVAGRRSGTTVAAATPRARPSSRRSRRSRAGRGVSPSRAAWRPRPRCCSRCGRAITWCSPTTSTAARTGCSRRCFGPWGLEVTTVRPGRSRRAGGGDAPADHASCGSRHPRTRC